MDWPELTNQAVGLDIGNAYTVVATVGGTKEEVPRNEGLQVTQIHPLKPYSPRRNT